MGFIWEEVEKKVMAKQNGLVSFWYHGYKVNVVRPAESETNKEENTMKSTLKTMMDFDETKGIKLSTVNLERPRL